MSIVGKVGSAVKVAAQRIYRRAAIEYLAARSGFIYRGIPPIKSGIVHIEDEGIGPFSSTVVAGQHFAPLKDVEQVDIRDSDFLTARDQQLGRPILKATVTSRLCKALDGIDGYIIGIRLRGNGNETVVVAEEVNKTHPAVVNVIERMTGALKGTGDTVEIVRFEKFPTGTLETFDATGEKPKSRLALMGNELFEDLVLTGFKGGKLATCRVFQHVSSLEDAERVEDLSAADHIARAVMYIEDARVWPLLSTWPVLYKRVVTRTLWLSMINYYLESGLRYLGAPLRVLWSWVTGRSTAPAKPHWSIVDQRSFFGEELKFPALPERPMSLDERLEDLRNCTKK